MARLIAPNGVIVEASEADEKTFLTNGYVKAEQAKADKPAIKSRRRTAKPKE